MICERRKNPKLGNTGVSAAGAGDTFDGLAGFLALTLFLLLALLQERDDLALQIQGLLPNAYEVRTFFGDPPYLQGGRCNTQNDGDYMLIEQRIVWRLIELTTRDVSAVSLEIGARDR
jgi:hypothetical protein